MSDETLIKVEGVSKKFCRDLKKSLWYGMKDLGNEILGRRHGGSGRLRPDEFWAVKDVNFELKRGDCLGLIGRNGAGKTTLLKMLNGLIKPDNGRIEMRGRIGALIALGAGFNPILTGRENIYINASILGLSKKETDSKLEDIIQFSGINKSIDSPVQTYSSGMQVRLGFAVATALAPDIILLDEVLAVGDAIFRNKCYQRLGERKQTSCAIFVSHNMSQIELFCNKVIVLSEGHVVFEGTTREGISIYENLIENDEVDDIKVFEKITLPLKDVNIHFDTTKVSYENYLTLRLNITSECFISKAILKIVFYDQQHRPCAEWNSERIGHTISLTRGLNSFEVKLGPILLKTGKYRLGIVLTDEYGLTMLLWSFKKHAITIDSFTGLGPSMAFRSEILEYSKEDGESKQNQFKEPM